MKANHLSRIAYFRLLLIACVVFLLKRCSTGINKIKSQERDSIFHHSLSTASSDTLNEDDKLDVRVDATTSTSSPVLPSNKDEDKRPTSDVHSSYYYSEVPSNHSTQMDRICGGRETTYHHQINLDLETFKKSKITRTMLDKAYQKYTSMAFYIHIRDNHFYVSFPDETFQYQKEEVRLRQILELFQAYSCHHKFPDVDLVLHVGDGIKDYNPEGLPIFTFQKHKDTAGILHPFYTHKPSILGQMQAGVDKYPWGSKKNLLFWRGKTTGGRYTKENWRTFPRTKLVDRCHQSDMSTKCDAAFYGYVQCDNNVPGLLEDSFGGVKSPIPMPEQMQYKFVASLDGNGPCSGRIEKLLSGNSVIFKADSERIEFYYEGIKPNVHYVPIQADMVDLAEKLEYAFHHDDQMRSIASNMYRFSQENLDFDSVACYMKNLFEEYAKLLDYTPKPLSKLTSKNIQVRYPHDPLDILGGNQVCTYPIFLKRKEILVESSTTKWPMYKDYESDEEWSHQY